jgi:hypothetical protein
MSDEVGLVGEEVAVLELAIDDHPAQRPGHQFRRLR